MDTAFYSIKRAHESAGLVSPNPLVNRVREATKRILGAKRCYVKESLSIEILKDIIGESLFTIFASLTYAIQFLMEVQENQF